MKKGEIAVLLVLTVSLLNVIIIPSLIIKNQKKNLEIFQWVGKEMGIEMTEEIPLPKVVRVSPEKLMEIAVEIMWRDFYNTPFKENLGDLNKQKIIQEAKRVLAQARKEGQGKLVDNQGCYDPYRNIIYLTSKAEPSVLVHEVVHYFQVQYQHRYPSKEEFRKATSVDKEKMLANWEELEEEAEEMAERWKAAHQFAGQ